MKEIWAQKNANAKHLDADYQNQKRYIPAECMNARNHPSHFRNAADISKDRDLQAMILQGSAVLHSPEGEMSKMA